MSGYGKKTGAGCGPRQVCGPTCGLLEQGTGCTLSRVKWDNRSGISIIPLSHTNKSRSFVVGQDSIDYVN